MSNLPRGVSQSQIDRRGEPVVSGPKYGGAGTEFSSRYKITVPGKSAVLHLCGFFTLEDAISAAEKFYPGREGLFIGHYEKGKGFITDWRPANELANI